MWDENEYTEQIKIGENHSVYYKARDNYYSCWIPLNEEKFADIHFSTKIENGKEGIINRSEAMMKAHANAKRLKLDNVKTEVIKDFKIFGFRVTIGTISYFKDRYWFWYFRKYTSIKGVMFRMFGIDFNIREKDGLNKMINKARSSNG